jgi:hypothetical protein
VINKSVRDGRGAAGLVLSLAVVGGMGGSGLLAGHHDSDEGKCVRLIQAAQDNVIVDSMLSDLSYALQNPFCRSINSYGL